MNNQIVPYADIEKMGVAICASKLFGLQTPEQAVALLLLAQAEGMHPAAAARDYHVIQGKPSLKADAMLARFQGAGGKVKWLRYTDKIVVGEFTHPSGGTVEIDWTIERAERAGLTKNPTWKKYPRNMLRSRVISEGIKTVFPGVAVGMYTVEEVEAFSDSDVVDIEAVEQQPAQEPQEPQEQQPTDQRVETDKVITAIDWFAENKKTVEQLDQWLLEKKDYIQALPEKEVVRLMDYVKQIKVVMEEDAEPASKMVIDI